MNIEHSIETQLDATASGESTDPTYEAPAIESILTPKSLEREVHYAGVVPTSGLETNSAAG